MRRADRMSSIAARGLVAIPVAAMTETGAPGHCLVAIFSIVRRLRRVFLREAFGLTREDRHAGVHYDADTSVGHGFPINSTRTPRSTRLSVSVAL